MRSVSITRSIFSGIVAGVALGLIIKWMEYITAKKVYILLLNVDYIPLLKAYHTSELFDFILHLAVSIFLALALRKFLPKDLALACARKFVLWISLAIGILLYPTTMFSDRTPEVTDLYALLLWMAGHGIYGWLLGYLLLEIDK